MFQNQSIKTLANESQRTRCINCKKGSADHDRNVTTACQSCSAGLYSATSGHAGPCTKCEGGRITASTNGVVDLTTCTTCAAGKWSLQGDINCTLCEVGKYGATSQVSACTSCEAGKYSAATQATACSLCPAGEFSGVGVTVCGLCPEGTYSGETSAVCTQCEGGREDADFNPVTACTRCSSGKAARGTDQSGEPVPCKDCVIGRYSSSDGKSECTACSTGQYQPQIAAQQCERCSAGTYSNFTAASACVDCEAGSYTARRAQNSIRVSVCAARTLSAAGQVPGHTIAVVGALKSSLWLTPRRKEGPDIRRPNSTHSLLQAGSSPCASCAPGTVAGEPRQSSCVPCDAGRFNAGLVASGGVPPTTCATCPGGSYASAKPPARTPNTGGP